MKDINELVKKYENKMEEVPLNRRYWLVRTDSGIYYEDFIENDYISIGWNEFSEKEYFTNKKVSENQRIEIKNKYPNNQESRIYNQIRRFIYDLNINDVVMIPNENSKLISFGIIKSDFYKRNISNKESFIKTRDIEWVTTISRKKLDPYLYSMMQAHQTINNADKYAHYIDRTMFSLYNKGDRCYLKVQVGKKGHLAAYDLSQYLNATVLSVELTNTLNFEKNENSHNIGDLDIKVNVQSRGWSLLSGTKELVTKVAAITNDALYSDIEELISDDETMRRAEQIKNVKEGLKRANAQLPDDLL